MSTSSLKHANSLTINVPVYTVVQSYDPQSFHCLREGYNKKSRIRETKHLSTDADSSTDTTVGWTKNSRKPKFFEKRKKIIQNAKTQKGLEICQY